jgi:putative peptide zinc metalloprotease protein
MGRCHRLIIPIGKGFSFLSSSPRLQRNRPRAVALTALAVGFAGLFLFVMPFPAHGGRRHHVALERSQIRAGTDSFIGRLLVANGSQVEPRQPL